MKVPKVILQDPTKLQAPPVHHFLPLSFLKFSPDGGVGTLTPRHAKTENQLAQVEDGDPPTGKAYQGGLLARKQKAGSSQRHFPEKKP